MLTNKGLSKHGTKERNFKRIKQNNRNIQRHVEKTNTIEKANNENMKYYMGFLTGLTVAVSIVENCEGGIMAKWYRINPVIGSQYEITERQAKRKINSRYWVRTWDSYKQEFNDLWQNLKDMDRDFILKVE